MIQEFPIDATWAARHDKWPMQKLISETKFLFDEFKMFAIRGNVIDLAVGIVIGGAFTTLVTGIVNGLVTPIVNLFMPGKPVHWGIFLSGVQSIGEGVFKFILLAAVVFFVFVKPMNKLRSMMAANDAKPTEPPPPTNEERLLTEIRDLLKEEKKG